MPQMERAIQLLAAGWVAPMDGPPVREGAVAFAGDAIIEAGPAALLRSKYPQAQVIERPDCTVLPGLINAHTHLELSEFSPGPAPASFVDWVGRLAPRGQATLEQVRQSAARSVAIGVKQCLKFGVTCVGDISRHCTITRPLLSDGPLRVVSYGEVSGMGQRRSMLPERLAQAADEKHASPRLRIGITPHAPYSVEPRGYRLCLELARRRNWPLATHLAETADEAAFLAHHTGPFRDLWDSIGGWDAGIPTFTGGPVRLAQSLGLLDYPTLLAHVNYCDQPEMDLLSRGRASVVYCPRTHAWFGHPPHRWRQMLERGINVAIGTDSCASSPDLNLVAELRILRQIAPDVPPHQLWRLTTIQAATALGMHAAAGTLSPAKAADWVLFPAKSADPLAEILDCDMLPDEVWIAGKAVGPGKCPIAMKSQPSTIHRRGVR